MSATVRVLLGLPAVNADVTLVFVGAFFDSRMRTHLGTVRYLFPHGERYDEPGFMGYASNMATEFTLADEDITWIRGHHAPASKEAQALLAAFLLVHE